jgi:clan AA aspartic protease
MNGHVDDKLRALIPISVAAGASDERAEVLAWVDTAFNGSLVIPRDKIKELRLVQESSAEAVLADGNTVELETYVCFLEWFGATYETQVVVNDSEFPLLGTMLLAGRRLEIDYEKQTVAIE